jgi:hypothetical protein
VNIDFGKAGSIRNAEAREKRLALSRAVASAAASETAGGGTLQSVAVAFTDGDAVRTVTVTDADVTAGDLILCGVRRAVASEDADSVHTYVVNVIAVRAGEFDARIEALQLGQPDGTAPNETVELIYTRETP